MAIGGEMVGSNHLYLDMKMCCLQCISLFGGRVFGLRRVRRVSGRCAAATACAVPRQRTPTNIGNIGTVNSSPDSRLDATASGGSDFHVAVFERLR